MSEAERAARPFNATLEYPGEAIVPSSFSLTAKSALSFGNNIKSIVKEGAATLHNAKHGTIRYELGDSSSFGAYHVIARRMKQGFTEDEAARIAVLVGWAAETGDGGIGQKGRLELLQSNVKAIVATDRENQNVLSGYIILNNRYRKKDKRQNAGVTLDALSSQDDYASIDLNSRQQMGAALERSIQWFNDIVNKYPQDFETVFESYVETLQIKHKTKLDGTFMLAPNGKQTNLNERQWLQVRTSAFKNWFGDWENDPANASKVVDENGEPMVVYHGTSTGGFHVFDDYAVEKLSDSPDGAYYFIADKNIAADYSINPKGYKQTGSMVYSVFLNIKNPKIIDFEGKHWNLQEKPKAFLMQNGKRIYNSDGSYFKNTAEARRYAKENSIERAYAFEETSDTITSQAMEEGLDGVIFKNIIDSAPFGAKKGAASDVYVAFRELLIS